MVVVMFAGMIVLGIPGEAGLKAIASGTSELRDSAPALVFLGMAATMTVSMVAWMRFRGHSWQPCLEMAASMIIPTLVAIGLLWADLSTFGNLMILEHVAMLVGMLVAMMLRGVHMRAQAPRRAGASHGLDPTAQDRSAGPALPLPRERHGLAHERSEPATSRSSVLIDPPGGVPIRQLLPAVDRRLDSRRLRFTRKEHSRSECSSHAEGALSAGVLPPRECSSD
jgi:hypothetical protein